MTRMKQKRRRYWIKRVNEEILNNGQPSVYMKPAVRRVAEITNEYVSGRATFEKRDNVWKLVDCAAELSWLKTTPFCDLKLELLRRGCRWTWI